MVVSDKEKSYTTRYGTGFSCLILLLYRYPFGNYALELLCVFLNMVPTKKVDKQHMKYGPWQKCRICLILRSGVVRPMIQLEPDEVWVLPELIPVRRSERPKNAPNRLCLNMEVEDDEVGDLGEPANYRAAMIDPDKVLWQGAMDEEMKSMKVNKVWIVVDRPPNAKVVRSKWLLQEEELTWLGPFSPVARDIRAIGFFNAIVHYYDYEIWQMDVKTAFLNGRLDEDIYMEQPEGYVDPKFPNGVCKLQRAIYGLKQASRQWNKRFDEEIKRFGFIQNRDEPCVYRKASGSDVVFLILYVDDILIMGNNIPKLKEVKDYLGKCSVKDLGEDIEESRYANSKNGFYTVEVKHDLSNEMCAYQMRKKSLLKRVPYAFGCRILSCIAVRCTKALMWRFAQILVRRVSTESGEASTGLLLTLFKRFLCASWQCDKDDTKVSDGLCLLLSIGGDSSLDGARKQTTHCDAMRPQSEFTWLAAEAAMDSRMDMHIRMDNKFTHQ
ncbi:retrotransposon protein, putative, ty1-copia subclass [Tanacetum coccineum]